MLFEPNSQVLGLAEVLKTNLDKGILGDDSDLQRRRNAFGSNNYPRKKGRSFWVNFDELSVIGMLIAYIFPNFMWRLSC